MDRMHVLYEMHPMFAPCPFASCTFLLVRYADEPWEPGNREHPTILHDSLTLTSFCTGISVSYRNRYVVMASFSDMLPWHHFCFTAVAPFSFRHGDKCLVSTCSSQLFHKNCLNLDYVIRIMLTTFKWLKLWLL